MSVKHQDPHPSHEHLFAYVEGGADDATQTHVQSCARCSEEVAAMGSVRALLKEGGRKGECPSAHALLGLESGFGPGAGDAALQAHVERCPRCAARLNALRAVTLDDADLGAFDAEAASPRSVWAWLEALPGRLRWLLPPEILPEGIAHRSAGASAPRPLPRHLRRGQRGHAEWTGEIQSGDYGLTLSITSLDITGRWKISGRLHTESGPPPADGLRVSLMAPEGEVTHQPLRYGVFTFTGIEAGSYALQIRLGEDERLVVALPQLS